MKLWVGVTDNEWFPFLSTRGLDEVNFWRPTPGPYFTTLEAGTPFLFKVKAPYNHITGGGYFVQYSTLPLEMAWEAFGPKCKLPQDQVCGIVEPQNQPELWDNEKEQMDGSADRGDAARA